MISPPSLMDDVDAVQAQIARNMLTSGDWVTARLDGVPYLEKAPLIYWEIAICYRIFGVHDWVARIPVAMAVILVAWLTAAIGVWAFGEREGFYAGLCMATCAGLWLFTRIQIPDVMLTGAVAMALWGALRALDESEQRPRLWASIAAASLGAGLLLKSAVAVLFPVAALGIYLLITRALFSAKTWKRLYPWSGICIVLAIAAPWHILATLRNPPYFDFTMHSAPGEYHGFFWFFFINEQVLRFLNLRYPRDYNTVPRLYFWLFHLIWLFPWSVYFPAVFKLSFRPIDRAGRMRLMALCWAGFILVFFTFSTTQEYYSMPCYPALALLLGSAMATDDRWIRRGTRLICGLAGAAAVIALVLCFVVRNVPTPGDISTALAQHPGAYTLSLGHIEDLTITSLAYLRVPLAMAGVAFAIGALGTLRLRATSAFAAIAVMMVCFVQAARVALVAFDPFMSSRPLAEVLMRSPAGQLIVDHHYYTFSSIFFYTNRDAPLLNGRFNNLVYGSYAPGAPDIFPNDADWTKLWLGPNRVYTIAKAAELPRFERLAGSAHIWLVAESGGKILIVNQPQADASPLSLPVRSSAWRAVPRPPSSRAHAAAGSTAGAS